MSEIATAYVQLVPTSQGMGGKIAKELGAEAEAAGKSAGVVAGESLSSSLGSVVKKAVVALGLGKIIKDSLEAGGALQQSYGGLDTIYGDASKQAKDFATQAVTAGISANDYAEQAVSFGAALKQAYSGDTYKAMEAANTAILDMADNSAKMGTDINSVQNAYQGFAKQNYTMLDNLKLGYGGTKGEMQRLLADAENLSGIKYDINNLGDVYDAIHVIQEDLGLTGVAAAEAQGTFTGSFASMQAAAKNLLANLSLGEDIQPSLNVLRQSIMTFLQNNLLPMIGNILQQAPQLITAVSSMAIQLLNIIGNNAGQWTTAGINLIGELAQGVLSNLPYILEAALRIGAEIINALISYDWIGGAKDFISEFSENMELAAGEILGTDGAGVITALIDGIMSTITDLVNVAGDILKELSAAISEALPSILSMGVEILTEVINGIVEALPTLITAAGDILNTLAEFIVKNLPMILDAGVDILLALVNGIMNNLPQIVTAIFQVITSIQRTIITHMPEILQKGIEIIGKLEAGIIKAAPNVLKAVFALLKAAAAESKKIDWIQLGKDVIAGIVKGLKNAGGAIWEAIKEACSEAWERTKEFFKIGSPSKLFEKEIGEMIPQGMAIGIENDADYVTDAMHTVAVESVNASHEVPYYGDAAPAAAGSGTVTFYNTFEINGANKDPEELAEEISYYINLQMNRKKAAMA